MLWLLAWLIGGHERAGVPLPGFPVQRLWAYPTAAAGTWLMVAKIA